MPEVVSVMSEEVRFCNGSGDVGERSAKPAEARNNFELWHLKDGDLRYMPITRQFTTLGHDRVVPFPEGARPLENQLGGHVSVVGKPSMGVLQDAEGHILKGLSQSDSRGLREANFYETVFFDFRHEARELLDELKGFLAVCTGLLLHDISGTHHSYLRLENITRGMRLPCSMDCKVGVVITDPLCPPAKKKVMEKKYVGTRKPLGISLIGIRYYDVRQKISKVYGRDFSHSVTASELDGVFEGFTNASVDKRVITTFLSQLERLKDWFEKQRIFNFISTSLYLCYDADLVIRRPTHHPVEEGGDRGNGYFPNDPLHWDPSKVVLKMIDFAHVFPADGQKDDNFLFGLTNLIGILRRVQSWGTYQRVLKDGGSPGGD